MSNVKVSCDDSCKVATLDPYPSDAAKLLAANTRFRVKVFTGTKGEAGNALAQLKAWPFTNGSC